MVQSGSVAPTAWTLEPAASAFVDAAVAAALMPPPPTRSTLLHGRLHGVPLQGPLAPDNQPNKQSLKVALGSHSPELAATLSVDSLGLGGTDDNPRRGAERLLDAFSSGLIMRLGDADVWADVEQYEHAQGFGSLPGGAEGVDRFVDRPGPAADPGSGFRPGRVTAKRTTQAKKALTITSDEATILWDP